MIVKILMALFLGVSLIKTISGTSISNVFVESETSPARYYPYSIPYGYTSVASPYNSQIKALSGSVPVYADPCLPPCVPGQTLTAARPSANIVTYNSPYATVPVLVGGANEDTNGYQYSYVVYDENTGDHKAQRELSDGSVVQGEYSFIQPDGYVRQVQYVADNLKGFNAVVKNYVPTASRDTKQSEIKHNKHGPPCHDDKKASLKEPLAGQLNGHSGNNKYDQEHNTSKNSHEGELEQSQENVKESKEKLAKTSSESIEHIDDENSKEKHTQVPAKHLQEKPLIFRNSDIGHKDISSENLEEKHWQKNKKKSNEESIEVSEDSVEKSPKNSKTSVEYKKESSEMSKEDLKEVYKKPKTESTESLTTYKMKSKTVSKEKSNESESVEDSKEATNVHIKHKEVHDLVMSPHKVFVPYYDIVRCLQASLRNSEGGPAALSQEPSLLTYLVLNKPC